MNSDDGAEILIARLKSLSSKDINQVAFLAHNKSESIKTPVNMNISDFINEVERLYNNNNCKKIWHWTSHTGTC